MRRARSSRKGEGLPLRPAVFFLLAALLPFVLGAEEPEGGWKSAEGSLRKAILSKNFEEAQRLVGVLADTDDIRGYKLILKYALGGHDYNLDRMAGRKLVAVASANVRKEVFNAVSKGRNAKTKIILLAVLRRWSDDPLAMKALHGELRSSRKEVVFAALRWIRDLDNAEVSMESLIDELARRERRPRDRIYFDLQRALEDLSGHKFSVAADWRNYWKGRKGGKKKPVPKKTSESRTVVFKRPSFFSVTVDSDRVLFIIDVSDSMKIPDTVIQKPRRPPEEPGRKGRTIVVKPGGSTGSERPPGPKSKLVPRITRVKHELLETLAGLPSHVRFGIMNFNHQIGFFGSPPPPLPEKDKPIHHAAAPSLIQASKANKEKAYDWVRALKPSGATRTDIAVSKIFGMPDIDTIYLLTDGDPRTMKNQKIPPEVVLTIAKIQNRFRKARIHTIGFAQAGYTMQKFCRDLAGQNDGKCVLLD